MKEFNNPTVNQLERLQGYENLFSKLANLFKRSGDQVMYLEYMEHKRRVYIEKQCVKGALRLKKAKMKKAPTEAAQLML